MSLNFADTTYRAGNAARPPRAQAQPPAAEPGRDWDAPVHFQDAGTLDPLDDMLAEGALPDEVQERLVSLSDQIEDLNAQIDGSAAEADSADADWERAKIDLANSEQAGAPEAQLTRLRAKVQKALQRRADASKHRGRLIAKRENTRKNLAWMKRYLESKRTFAPDGQKQFDVTPYVPDRPDGDSVDIAPVYRGKAASHQAEKKTEANAPIPLEDAKARVRNFVRMRGLDAEVSARYDADGPVKLVLPMRRLDVPSNPDGRIPQGVDVEALVCKFMGDQLLAEIERQIEADYEGVELTLQPHEKHRRLKEIDAAILQAERIECAAIWEMIEQGDWSLPFRPDTDPRALLGIA